MKTLGPPGLRVVASAEKVSTLDGAALHVTHYARKTGPEAGINSIDFNQFSLRDSELVPAVVGVFDSLGLCQGMGITKQNLAKMVSKCMSLYHRQPYHNFRHAFDVLQAANLLLHGTKLAETASRPEVFSLLAAALLHDVGHPGLSNDFHKKNTTPYAVLAKPIEDTCDTLASHPNEYYHCEIMQNLLLGEDGLLPHGQFSEELRCEVGRLVQQLIFATDPATQKSFLARLDKQIEEGLDIYSTNPDDRLLALSVVIRCADTFHPFRPFSLHQYWALHITEEFAGQAKLETARRRDDNPVQSEPSKLGQDTIGFLNALVCPVLLRLITLFNSRNKPFFDLLTQRLATNKNYWESHDLRQEMRADEAKKVDCITTHHLSGHALSKDELSVSCVGYS